MTLNLAIKYQGGIVIASDSRVTYDAPLMRNETEKIETIWNFALVGAGLTGPLHRVINNIKFSGISPSTSFDEAIEICEDIMWNFYQKYAERIKKSDEEEDWSLILASKDRIFRILSTGWCEEEPNYATDGSADLYGEYILKQRYSSLLNENEAINLAIYTIIQASKIDPNVGGKVCISIVNEKGVTNLDRDKIDEMSDNIMETFIEIEQEIQKIVHDIIEKRRHINNLFNHKFNFELFEQNEYAISEIQKLCKSENDFTNKISSLALLIDGINVLNLKKGINTDKIGSINVLEEFLNKNYKNFNTILITNLRDIMTLRSKKMPIHEDDPKIISVILKWEHKYPPIWSSLWKKALYKFTESLELLESIF